MAWFMRAAAGWGSLSQTDATGEANTGMFALNAAPRVRVYTVTGGGAVTLRGTTNTAWGNEGTPATTEYFLTLPADIAVPDGGGVETRWGDFNDRVVRRTAPITGYKMVAGTHSIFGKNVNYYDEDMETDYGVFYYGGQVSYAADSLITAGTTAASVFGPVNALGRRLVT